MKILSHRLNSHEKTEKYVHRVYLFSFIDSRHLQDLSNKSDIENWFSRKLATQNSNGICHG